MNPYLEILKKLNASGIKYVVVGLFGINFYSESAATSFSTNDLDVFIDPTVDNVKRSCNCLKELDMNLSFKTGKETVKEYSDKDLLTVVRERKVIVASDQYGIVVELLFQISGLTFAEINNNAKIFNVEGIPVRVGKLEDLLLSKRIAGRKKDKLFLKRFEAE
ncbi:MAG: nucleotidyltransferase [Candidatus Aureabacteria bacterium]|nr:nucleotidyltransferase [Candidatus Auribacterota bacterium]